MEIYEISARNTIDADGFRNLMASFFSIPVNHVLSFDEFWPLVGESRSITEPRAGFEVQHASKGLQSFLEWAIDREMNPEEQLRFASSCAERFQSQIVIGNMFAKGPHKQFEYLSISPHAQICEAIKLACDGYFEVKVTSPYKDLSLFITEHCGRFNLD